MSTGPSAAAPPAVVAIGDLHGYCPALDRLLDAIQGRYRIFSETTDRLIPSVTLVFTGDYIDRGDSAVEIIKRLDGLQRINGRSKVVTLFGNHELLALEAYDIACRLATANRSGSGAALDDYLRTSHGCNGGMKFLLEFGGTESAALKSYIRQMSRDGDVGRWMRSLLPYYEMTIGNYKVLFLHGDLSRELLKSGALDRYKQELLAILRTSTIEMGGSEKKYGHDWLTSSAGFFWSRSFEKLHGISAGVVKAICDKAGVNVIVTGHNPQPPRITCYGGRIFDIDVGMTPAYWPSLDHENVPWALLLWTNGRMAGFSANGELQEFKRLDGQMELFAES